MKLQSFWSNCRNLFVFISTATYVWQPVKKGQWSHLKMVYIDSSMRLKIEISEAWKSSPSMSKF